MDEKRISEALRTVDINLYDENGVIRGFHEISDELEAIWELLDFREQCHITKEIREGMEE